MWVFYCHIFLVSGLLFYIYEMDNKTKLKEIKERKSWTIKRTESGEDKMRNGAPEHDCDLEGCALLLVVGGNGHRMLVGCDTKVTVACLFHCERKQHKTDAFRLTKRCSSLF